MTNTLIDNETLALLEDCRDLMVDINSNLSRMDSSKKVVEDQVKKLNNILDKKINHMFI
jgi:hypothetical protein